MKAIKLTLLAAIVLTTGITAVKAQTADEIMEKYQKAIGGATNLAKIKTVKMIGSMSIQGMDIAITQTMAVGKAVRTDISAMGMNGFTIVTKTEGWMYMPFQGGTKIDTMKPEMVKAQQSQLDMKSKEFLDYKSKGTKADYAGKDTVDKAVCYKVKFTDKDGNETMSFFDAATYYLLRTESKVKVDDQEQEVTVAFNNYKKMDEGIVMPMSFSAQGAEFNFKTIEINKPIDENVFKPTMPTAETETKSGTEPGTHKDPKASPDNKPKPKG